MATFNEISSEYAEKIKSSFITIDLTKTASIITESINRDKIFKLLKEIANDIKAYTINSQPLSESSKQEIFGLVGKKLGLSKPEKIYLMIKEASNDKFTELVSYWEQFKKEIKL